MVIVGTLCAIARQIALGEKAKSKACLIDPSPRVTGSLAASVSAPFCGMHSHDQPGALLPPDTRATPISAAWSGRYACSVCVAGRERAQQGLTFLLFAAPMLKRRCASACIENEWAGCSLDTRCGVPKSREVEVNVSEPPFAQCARL